MLGNSRAVATLQDGTWKPNGSWKQAIGEEGGFYIKVRQDGYADVIRVRKASPNRSISTVKGRRVLPSMQVQLAMNLRALTSGHDDFAISLTDEECSLLQQVS